MREWLPSGATVAGYQISSRLSAQGMGEVYLAREPSSGFEVVLKLWPNSFVEDQKIRARFSKIFSEIAKLKHRNLCEIYEAGVTDEGRPFAAMEQVKGQSLDLLGYGHQLTLSEIVALIIQIAEALEAAHSRGWLHLAIKPSNLMLTPSGQVKILDLGQALAFPQSLSEESDQRRNVELAAARYLSPEQVSDERPDQRSDIFSLGVICYELIAGHPPFVGSSMDEVLAAITIAEPLSLAEFREDLSPELNRIIAKTLAKNVNDRYQTAGQLAQDLRRLNSGQRYWAKLIRGAEADRPLEPPPLLKKNRPRGLIIALFIAGGLIAVLAAGRWLNRATEIGGPGAIQLTRLTTNGKVTEAALSPDGRILAYAVDEGGRQTMLVKELENSQERRLVSMTGKEYHGVTFSPDGQWIGYVKTEPGGISGDLYRFSLDGGGEEDLKTSRVIGTLSFSSDGTMFAFVRANETGSETTLVIGSAEAGGKEINVRRSPSFFTPGGVAWAPDGRVIAAVVKDPESGLYLKIVTISVSAGTETTIASKRWSEIDRLAWLPNGSGLIVAASEPASSASQLWQVSYPSGEIKRFTQDLNDYRGAGVTADAQGVVTVQSEALSNIWTAPASDFNRAQQLTTERYDGVNGLTWTPDGRIVYVSWTSGRETIWLAGPRINDHRLLPVAPEGGEGGEFHPAVSPDGRFLVYVAGRANGAYLWRTELERRNLKRLSDESQVFFPSISPAPTGNSAQGQMIVYSVLRGGRRVVARSSIEGGPPVTLIEKQAWRPVISPDGTRIACNYLDEATGHWKIAVFLMTGGEPMAVFDAPGSFQRNLRWTPDGASVAYPITRAGVTNIWAQPIAGGEPRPVTNFRTGRIFDFVWARNGRNIAFAQGWVISDVVVVRNFR